MSFFTILAAVFAPNISLIFDKYKFTRMVFTEKVKQLVADGRTVEALDLLQENLRSKDTKLFNQTVILESQYKSEMEKMRTGIEMSLESVNRVNYAILEITDDAEKLLHDKAVEAGQIVEAKKVEEAKTLETQTAQSNNTLKVIAAIVGATGLLFALIFGLGNKTPTVATPTTPVVAPQPTTDAPLEDPKTLFANLWKAEPFKGQLKNNLYGNIAIEIVRITEEKLDNNRDILNLEVNYTCDGKFNGTCQDNYIRYIMELGDNKGSVAPETETDNGRVFADGTTEKHNLKFIVPKGIKNATLGSFYVAKRESIIYFTLVK